MGGGVRRGAPLSLRSAALHKRGAPRLWFSEGNSNCRSREGVAGASKREEKQDRDDAIASSHKSPPRVRRGGELENPQGSIRHQKHPHFPPGVLSIFGTLSPVVA